MAYTPAATRELDRARYPLTVVQNVDEPTSPGRLIRLSPREAVVWAYASHIGDDASWEKYGMYRRRGSGGWSCGGFWAADPHMASVS